MLNVRDGKHTQIHTSTHTHTYTYNISRQLHDSYFFRENYLGK